MNSQPDAPSTSAPPATASKELSAKEIEDAIMMPPPPNPPLKVILEPEMNGLLESLQNAIAQTGLVYKFYAKVKGANVQAPQSVTASLGREVERYDQICDTIEARVLRALAVLQRDLSREQKRIEEERVALKAKEEAEKQAAGTPKQATPEPDQPETSQPSSSPLSNTPLGRRPSSISISSLHRPSLPGKLDLSSASFRLSTGEDNPVFQTGLASPVTLAPKSARPLGPNELASDFLSAFGGTGSELHGTDIDLTLPDVIHNQAQGTIDLTAGGSSDKPIDLDIDIDMDMNINMGLFEEEPDSARANQQGGDDLFSPANGPSLANAGFLPDTQGDNILSALGDASTGGLTTIKQEEETLAIPSPASFLASFPSPAQQGPSDEQHQFDLGSLSLDMFSNAQNSGDIDFTTMEFAMDDQSHQQNPLTGQEENPQLADPSKPL